jgi:hypothetical protein
VVLFFVRAAEACVTGAIASGHAALAVSALVVLAILMLVFTGWVLTDEGRTRRLVRLLHAARRDPRSGERRGKGASKAR